MRLLKELVGRDEDASALLAQALTTASERVVVKRALHAPRLADKTPQTVIQTAKHRFDIYLV